MIDDKLMFLSDKDIAVDCEKTFMPEENTAIRSLPTGSSSTDQSLIEDSSFTDQPLPADEQKAIANQVKVKQDAMAIFSKSTENVAVKQYKMVCQIVDDRLAPLETERHFQ
uniref:Uncharacterized protein n=1 Tax=Arion vulgaris TaxID=1028688 RepID=A0A0B7AQ78_9EUPU